MDFSDSMQVLTACAFICLVFSLGWHFGLQDYKKMENLASDSLDLASESTEMLQDCVYTLNKTVDFSVLVSKGLVACKEICVNKGVF